MSLPKRFDKELRRAIAARSVWLPGKPVQLGDILVKRSSSFHKAGHINNFGGTLESAAHSDISLDLKTSKVKQRIFQAGIEMPGTAGLDLSADASVKLEFRGENQFILKTPTLSGASIQNMLQIAMQLSPLNNWRHDKYYIVEEVYGAVDWAFLGSKQNSSNVEIRGKGSGILSFLTAGASLGLKSSGSVDVKIMGKGGMIGMNLVRVRKNGSLNHG
ncbi:MAG: hypothetical protein V3V15_00480 [Sphingorhabdus sp.]